MTIFGLILGCAILALLGVVGVVAAFYLSVTDTRCHDD